MPGHFDSIGFVADDEADLQPFVQRALREGDQLEVLGADAGYGGKYLCWSPGGGAQIWVNLNEKGEVLGFDPHYAGRGRAHVTLERSFDYDTAPPTGGVFAWVGLGTAEETRAGFDLPAFARFYDMACDYDGNALVQPAAFAHGCEAFDTVEAYLAAQQEVHADRPELAFAVESYLALGLLAGEDERIPPATARLSGIVLETSRPTNPATGRSFHAALVKTVGMTVDVVADDVQMTGVPRKGGVIAGSFWMSAVPAEGPRRPAGPAAKITISRVGDE